MKVPQVLTKIVEKVTALNGRALLVGGAVRDFVFTGAEPKDFDVEIHGIDPDTVKALLSKFGDVKAVGESFGVIKMTVGDDEFDFSLPRRENKTGRGHKGFLVDVDPTMTPHEAASRRDFTVNSMMLDLSTGEIDDPFNGKADLGVGVLRHTSDAFAEDALRVLRAVQFAGRFGFTVASDTAKLCASLVDKVKFVDESNPNSPDEEIARSRVWGEWEKWAKKSKKPGAGIKALFDMGWDVLFPELSVLKGLEQEADWHPEGDVLEHTIHTVNAAAAICDRDGLVGDDRAKVLFGALCHDFGKVDTTEVNEAGRIVSPAHDVAGVKHTESFLRTIGAPKDFLKAVPVLVKEHMVHIGADVNARLVRRLSDRVDGKTTVELVDKVIEADHSGRPPLPAKHPAPDLMRLAKELQVERSKPKPFLTGKHLIDLGLKPGPQFKELLGEAYELQMGGEIVCEDTALNWVKEKIAA